jgi:hypothetical protein
MAHRLHLKPDIFEHILDEFIPLLPGGSKFLEAVEELATSGAATEATFSASLIFKLAI